MNIHLYVQLPQHKTKSPTSSMGENPLSADAFPCFVSAGDRISSEVGRGRGLGGILSDKPFSIIIVTETLRWVLCLSTNFHISYLFLAFSFSSPPRPFPTCFKIDSVGFGRHLSTLLSKRKHSFCALKTPTSILLCASFHFGTCREHTFPGF